MPAFDPFSWYGAGQYGSGQYGVDDYVAADGILRHQFNIPVADNVTIPLVKTVWNEYDEQGALTSIARLRGETNWAYKRRILDAFVNVANSSYRGLVNGITRELGLSLFQPLSINPKVDGNGDFLAPDPYIKFDEAFIYLYSDYKNGLLDWKIDRYELGGNLEHLVNLVTFINTTYFFEASIINNYDNYTRSMTIINQSNRIAVDGEALPASTRFKLDHDKIARDSVYFNDFNTFGIEVTSEDLVTSRGKYWIDYQKGIIRTYSIPSRYAGIRYEYSVYPFKPIASEIILHDINSDTFKEKMFSQVLQDDGTYVDGIPTELGVDIINELYSIVPMYWGV